MINKINKHKIVPGLQYLWTHIQIFTKPIIIDFFGKIHKNLDYCNQKEYEFQFTDNGIAGSGNNVLKFINLNFTTLTHIFVTCLGLERLRQTKPFIMHQLINIKSL